MMRLETVVAPAQIVVDAAAFTEPHIPPRTKHLFIAERQGDRLVLHVAPAEHHKDIVAARGIDPAAVVGGGLTCLLRHADGTTALWLGGKSGDFDAIPTDVQARFVVALAELLRARGLRVDAAHGDQHPMRLHAFWQ